MLFPRRRSGALVVQTGYMGDVVLTTPLLSALAARHGPVDVITTPSSAPLLETHPAVREVLRYDKRGADRGWRGIRRLAAEIRRRRYATAYLPHRSWRSATLAFLARVPERVGFTDSPATRLYTTSVPRPGYGHETARLAALAGVLPGGPLPPTSLGLTETDWAEAERWLGEHGIRGEYVALAPGSIWGAKRWPYYPELAARLSGPAVAIGGPSDAGLCGTVAAAAPERVHSAAGQVGPRTSAALMARAAAVVTNDAAPLHLAGAVGTPVVAIFGPSAPSFGFAPLGPVDVVLEQQELLCRPCSAHGPAVCPLEHHRCLQELGVGIVADALSLVLSRSEARRAVCHRD